MNYVFYLIIYNTFVTAGPINYLYYQKATQNINCLDLNKGYLRHLRANIGWLN